MATTRSHEDTAREEHDESLAAKRVIPVSGAETQFVVVNGTRLEVKWAEVNATAAGDTTVVAAVASKKIRVLSLDFVCSTAVAVAWKSGAATTRRQAQSFAGNSGLVRDLALPFFVETVAGEALVVNLSAVANVRGMVGYVEV